MPQGAADVVTGSVLDALTNKEVADVRIAPTTPRFEVEAVGRNAVQHLPHPPRLLAEPNGLVIGRKTAVVRNAGTVLKQLAQRIGTAVNPIVEVKMAPSDEL